MIKKEKIYIQDIAKAPFIDRFCYCLFNAGIEYSGKEYIGLNPLKWSIMTFLHSTWLLICYLLIITLIGIPCITYDAYKMPSQYESSEFKGWFQNDVYLLRELPK